MKVNFYINKDDLDQLDRLIKTDILNVSDYKIKIKVYRDPDYLKTIGTRNKYFMVSINYEDFMRIEDFLVFLS